MSLPQQPKFDVAYFGAGSQIVFPINRARLPFLPQALIVNNRTNANIQVGASSSGPFQVVAQYVRATLPWQTQGFYVKQLGTGALISTDFLEVDIVAGPLASGDSYITSFQSYGPSGWGPVGPQNFLVPVNAGDPFNWGQIQQVIDALTGIMSGQAYTLNGPLTVQGSLSPQNSVFANGLVQITKDGSGTSQIELQSTDATVTTLDVFAVGGILYFQVTNTNGTANVVEMRSNGTNPQIGFLGASPVIRQTVSGSQGGNAALASLLTALGAGKEGLITDSSAAGDLVMTNRFQGKMGTSTSSANNLTLPGDGNAFQITGTTQINLIDTTGWQGGSIITLSFASNPVVKNGQATSGSNLRILLNGNVDFAPAVGGATLTLLYDTSGTPAWRETGRKT